MVEGGGGVVEQLWRRVRVLLYIRVCFLRVKYVNISQMRQRGNCLARD